MSPQPSLKILSALPPIAAKATKIMDRSNKLNISAIVIGSLVTATGIILQIVIANWAHTVKPGGGPMGSMTTDIAFFAYVVLTLVLAAFGGFGMSLVGFGAMGSAVRASFAVWASGLTSFMLYGVLHIIFAGILFLAA
ncbi:MAG: hypothetical protein AAF483_07265 [Planctomycetota bacterium]